jgi:hypothetical protein
VKFSKTPGIDLMVFSEHCSYFHLVDTRSFNEEQVIRVQETDKNITGVAFDIKGTNLYVGVEDCIFEYEIDVLKRRTFDSGDLL